MLLGQPLFSLGAGGLGRPGLYQNGFQYASWLYQPS